MGVGNPNPCIFQRSTVMTLQCTFIIFFIPQEAITLLMIEALHISIQAEITLFKYQKSFSFLGGYIVFFFLFPAGIFFYCCSRTVVPIFPPPLSPAPPTLTSHPPSFPTLALSMGPLYMFLDDPFPSFPYYPPPPSPLVTVSLFFISTSMVIFCLQF